MPNLNKVMLMGNLTRDVDLRKLQSGTVVGDVGLAVNRRWKDDSGQQREEVTFVDLECWNRTAENMSKYLSKGRPVFIEGRLKLDQWKDKDGSNRSKLKVVVESFQFVDSKQQGEQPDQTSRPAAQAAASPPRQAPQERGGYEPIQEDDIPF